MKILALITNNKEITDNIGSFRCESIEVTAFRENEHILYYLEEYLPEYIIFDSEKKSNGIEEFLKTHPDTKIFLPYTNKYFKKYPNTIGTKEVYSVATIKKILKTIISLDDENLKEKKVSNPENLKIINQPVISMLSVKGGTGSTSTALNIAAIASEEYKLKTAFIDFNFSEAYSDVSSYLRTGNLQNLFYYLLNYKEGINALKNAFSFSSRNGLDVFISPLSSKFINRLDEDILNSFLYQLKSSYSFIIFDYPANLFSINSFFSSLADLVASFIITALPSELCARKIHALNKVIKANKKIHCILNNVCASQTISRNEFEELSGCRVVAEIPYQLPEIQKKLKIDNFLTEIIDIKDYLRIFFTNYLKL